MVPLVTAGRAGGQRASTGRVPRISRSATSLSRMLLFLLCERSFSKASSVEIPAACDSRPLAVRYGLVCLLGR